MPSIDTPRWVLCIDGGGTACKAVAASTAGVVVRGIAGACNVKTVGHQAAIAAILAATSSALAQADLPPPPPGFFSRVWLGLAGVLHQADIDAFAPYAQEAFGFAPGDSALRISNDGHLLASPCLRLEGVDSAVAIVAGTGSVGLAFRKSDGQAELVGRSGGWGYLLGDEGSGYAVARLAITRLLADDDARVSASLAHPAALSLPCPTIFSALLSHLDVPDAAALIDVTYSGEALRNAASFTLAETHRKVWVAEAARVVFSFAYEQPDVDAASQGIALSILAEAVAPLVGTVERLVGKRTTVVPERAVLSLGGGMWKAEGYRRLLLDGLREKGIVFGGGVRVAESAAEEGALALKAQLDAGL
ncbi:hypothetical protein JCM8097_002282 [Rhodosporidiobolus ruineniae]